MNETDMGFECKYYQIKHQTFQKREWKDKGKDYRAIETSLIMLTKLLAINLCSHAVVVVVDVSEHGYLAAAVGVLIHTRKFAKVLSDSKKTLEDLLKR